MMKVSSSFVFSSEIIIQKIQTILIPIDKRSKFFVTQTKIFIFKSSEYLGFYLVDSSFGKVNLRALFIFPNGNNRRKKKQKETLQSWMRPWGVFIKIQRKILEFLAKIVKYILKWDWEAKRYTFLLCMNPIVSSQWVFIHIHSSKLAHLRLCIL